MVFSGHQLVQWVSSKKRTRVAQTLQAECNVRVFDWYLLPLLHSDILDLHRSRNCMKEDIPERLLVSFYGHYTRFFLTIKLMGRPPNAFPLKYIPSEQQPRHSIYSIQLLQ